MLPSALQTAEEGLCAALIQTCTSTTAEAQQPLCCTHQLGSANAQQVLLNGNGCHFLCMEEFTDTPLLHLHSHIRQHSVRLSFCCHFLKASSNRILVRRFNLYFHTTTSISDVKGQHNNIGGLLSEQPSCTYLYIVSISINYICVYFSTHTYEYTSTMWSQKTSVAVELWCYVQTFQEVQGM